MARIARPWRREDRGGDWWAWVDKKRTWLAPAGATKTQAQAVLTDLLSRGKGKGAKVPVGGFQVRDLINLFLTGCAVKVERGELEPVTLAGYERYLLPARAKLGKIAVESLKPADALGWVDGTRAWGPTSRYNALTALKRALNWAVDQEYLKKSPLARLKRPTPNRRGAVLTPDQIKRIIEALPASDPFRDFVEGLRETGCRPGELRALTASQVNARRGTWTVTNKTRRATGEMTRTVYLSDRALEISRRLVKLHPTGPIFRNARDRAWTRNAVALRLRRLGKKLDYGPETVAYSFRHDFCTRALERGIDPATVAELMGHKSLDMIMRVYNQLKHRTDHLREAARAARGERGERGD